MVQMIELVDKNIKVVITTAFDIDKNLGERWNMGNKDMKDTFEITNL